MKLKALASLIALGLIGASVAFAAPPPGKGYYKTTTGVTTAAAPGKKPPKSGPGCKPAVSVILTGTLAADGAAAPTSLAVTLKGGNHFARAYKNVAQPLGIAVTTSTKINRQGDHNAADLKNGDRVNIRARVCKADLAGTTLPSLTALRVVAHPAPTA